MVLVELETLKAYIKANQAERFIKPSMLLAGISILFDQKSNRFFYLYIDYRGLNNPMIKNWYLLLLVGNLLDCLKRARRFIHFDFISANH